MIQWHPSHTWVSFDRTRITPSFFYWSNSLFGFANPAHLEVLLLKPDTLIALILFLEQALRVQCPAASRQKTSIPSDAKLLRDLSFKMGGSLWTQNRAEVKSPWSWLAGCVTSGDPEFESQTEQRALVEMDEEAEVRKWKQAVPLLGNCVGILRRPIGMSPRLDLNKSEFTTEKEEMSCTNCFCSSWKY